LSATAAAAAAAAARGVTHVRRDSTASFHSPAGQPCPPPPLSRYFSLR